MKHVLDNIQVNIPYHMLTDGYLDLFLKNGLNPEIGLDANSLDSCSKTDFRHMAAYFIDRGRRITLHGPFMDLSPGSSDPAILDATRHRLGQVLELVSVVPVHSVVCHAGYDQSRYGFEPDEWLDTALDTWRWLGSEIRRLGSRLMLENVYEEHAHEIFALFDSLDPSEIGFCFDAGHMHAFGDGSMTSWLKMLGRRIGQVHLHDNNGQTDEHLALGKGTIRFDPLFELLVQKGTAEVTITMEPHSETDLWPGVEYLAANLSAFFEKSKRLNGDSRKNRSL